MNVVVFPHSEICGSYGYLLLTAAYRSLSRPSSAPDAKAFTLCSYSLELPFLWSITFVAMIDPWFSFFRIAWVSWTFWLSLLACKKVCIIAFFLALFRIFHLSVKLYCTFVLPNFILGKTNKMCCFYLSSNICSFSTQNINFYIDFFLIRLSKISFARFYSSWSVWMDSNHRPRAYQARALTTWATDRFELIWYPIRLHIRDIAWFDSVFVCFPSRDVFQTRSESSPSMPPALAGGGDEGNRTLDPLLAGQVLSQLSYTPI